MSHLSSDGRLIREMRESKAAPQRMRCIAGVDIGRGETGQCIRLRSGPDYCWQHEQQMERLVKLYRSL